MSDNKNANSDNHEQPKDQVAVTHNPQEETKQLTKADANTATKSEQPPPKQPKPEQKPDPKPEPKNSNAPSKSSSGFSKLGLLSLLISLGLGGYLFYQQQNSQSAEQKVIALTTEVSNLKSQLAKTQDELTQFEQNKFSQLESQYKQLDQSLTERLTQQNREQTSLVKKVEDSLLVNEQQLKRFNEELQAVTDSDNGWLISQANYLVNLASRKIWNEKDYATARLLLKNADMSLIQANDQRTIPARKAIAEDINTLANLSYTDIDGIIINLMRLSDSINQLPLTTESKVEAPKAETTNEAPKEVSDSIDDWQDNLMATGESFLSNFISVSKIEESDPYTECLSQSNYDKSSLEKCHVFRGTLPPEQASYLRENLKLKLLIAAQAVSRHQNTIYHNALDDVELWVKANFNTQSSATQDFLDELKTLQSISIEVDDSASQLNSIKALNDLMKLR